MDFLFFKIEGTGFRFNRQRYLNIESFDLEDFPLILISRKLKKSIKSYVFKTINTNEQFKFFIDGYLKDDKCFGLRCGINCSDLTGLCNCCLKKLNQKNLNSKQQLKCHLIETMNDIKKLHC
ncbi:hypothetical protein LDVICp110 [lymphocystis disease virus-China]|uniref:Uncharacterized protein n=1 Tax=lymphocystis disease virus-China TaxID=256729 RepID=Q678A2_9VIRU|nr:hypothetical protein LDVICp110 [lymphocystis disease virus-China]AAU10955.1 hypothetical protein [lymphocystis disease virus-China]